MTEQEVRRYLRQMKDESSEQAFRGFYDLLLGHDYHNGNTYKHGNSNLLWRLDKDSLANQSAIFLVIRATGICWNQVVCKRLAGKQRLCLK